MVIKMHKLILAGVLGGFCLTMTVGISSFILRWRNLRKQIVARKKPSVIRVPLVKTHQCEERV